MATSAAALEQLLVQPALSPPDGITPNFENPPNENTLAWFVTTLCMVIATLCLAIRAYDRVVLSRVPAIEEVLMFCAYAAYWGTAYAGYSMIFTPGYYVHTWDLTNGDLIRPLYLILVYGCSYSATMPLIKVAILLDWCRIFVPDRTRSVFWWTCMTLVALQVSWGIACIILLNLQCIPHQAIWEFYLPSKCFKLPKVMLTSASVQVFTDFVMILLPQRIIWSLHLNWRRKIGMSLVFGTGILACVGATVRLSTTITFAHESDTMYYIGPLLFWACAEMTIGFFILCVPCLPKVLHESGISRAIRSTLTRSKKSSVHVSNDGPSHEISVYPRKRKTSVTISETYLRMEEEEIGLKDRGARPGT
ncbi:hypothetical protein G7054_g2885 [Neopestalotiopsis clavispora]|nr:hypothetical protein G7054_g2885 [Neopestalotiopsis clavispora]